MPIMVRLTDELRDRIDATRPATTSREAWVRAACERELGRLDGPLSAAAQQHVDRTIAGARPAHHPKCSCATCKPPKRGG